LAPRALEDNVRPRRLSGVVVRPLNFTVRRHEDTAAAGSPQYFVKTLSLTLKRAIAAAYLAVLILCASNYYLDWGVLGGARRTVQAIVGFIGVLGAARYGPALVEEIREYRRRQGGL